MYGIIEEDTKFTNYGRMKYASVITCIIYAIAQKYRVTNTMGFTNSFGKITQVILLSFFHIRSRLVDPLILITSWKGLLAR